MWSFVNRVKYVESCLCSAAAMHGSHTILCTLVYPQYDIPHALLHFKQRCCRVITMIGAIALYGRHCSIPLMPWQNLQHNFVCCSPLRHTHVFKGRCCRVIIMIIMRPLASNDTATHCNHCNTLQHTATYCNTHHYGRSDRTPW